MAIGGRAPISIQSMTKSDTKDVKAVIKEIHKLEKTGCEIVRVSTPDIASVNVLPSIIKEINIPLIADIHFDWRLAIKAIEKGVNGIRVNPGNVGERRKIKEIVKAARSRNVVIRVGVNSGSISDKWIKKSGGITSSALVGSALEYVKIIEDTGYTQIKISIKAPDIQRTVSAYRLISKKTSYPLHIGVTEAGPPLESTVRSSIALGILLAEGIGDTVRVSVTGPSLLEIIIAKEILQSLGLRSFGPSITSCPTCARCKVNLFKIVNNLKKRLQTAPPDLATKVAVMGCVVNGPGEAKEADIGIACGMKSGMLFLKGKPIRRVPEKDMVDVLMEHIRN